MNNCTYTTLAWTSIPALAYGDLIRRVDALQKVVNSQQGKPNEKLRTFWLN